MPKVMGRKLGRALFGRALRDRPENRRGAFFHRFLGPGMPPRLQRYKSFMEKDFIESLTRNKEYSLHVKEDLKRKMGKGGFKNIVFVGMGCSAIVSDVIKGFFIDQKIPTGVRVANDYDFRYTIGREVLKDSRTLVIFSSYSGHSKETIEAYGRIKGLTKNIIFLTSGGRLGGIGERDSISIIYWKLKKADREYPLFHVPQYFSILLDVFHGFGLLGSNYEKELAETAEYLKGEFAGGMTKQAKGVAKRLRGREIILLASPEWHLSLLKLTKMHFNEIAMVPAHRNFLHEFAHSEVATLTSGRQAILIFKGEEDGLAEEKIGKLSDFAKENKNAEVVVIDLGKGDFFKQFFSALLFVQHITYSLGSYYRTESKDLISRASGNTWYSSERIQEEAEPQQNTQLMP